MDALPEGIAFVPCHSANYGGLRLASDIRYLVYHYTGNDGDTAANNAAYYAETVVRSSAHYFVDDGGVTQSVPDRYVAWAVGGRKWRDCAETGGGTLHGVVTNGNSLSVELCDTRRDGSLQATEATLANGAALGRLLMARYDIPIENVVRHFDVTGKHCPAYFMDNDRWAAFKARLTQEEDTNLERYQTIEDIKKSAPWAAETIGALVERGALKGNGAGLDLSMDMLRLLVIHDRMGLYR